VPPLLHSTVSSNALVSVVAGLAIGIAFVILFSVLFVWPMPLTNEQVMGVAGDMPEVKAFMAAYPDGKVQVYRTEYNKYSENPVMVYSYEKIYDDGKINQSRLLIGLDKTTAKPSRAMLMLNCAVSSVQGFGGITVDESGTSIVESLQKTECAK
jgi:hypothetical protein